jgi:hypothetical protein
MPYSVRKKGSEWCVIKDSDGKSMGCHETRAKAERQRRALYASEASAQDVRAEGHDLGGEMETLEETTAQLALEENEDEVRRAWDGVLATIMSPTSDGRIIEEGVAWRDLPVPFAVQVKTAEGHDGAECCGRIEELAFIPFSEFDRADEFDMDEVRDGAIVVYGWGTLDGSPASEEAQRLLNNGAGVSLDGLHFSGKLWNSEDLSEVVADEMQLEELLEGLYSGAFLRGMTGKISGLTVVNTPAFEEATVMVASAVSTQIFFRNTMTASAAGLAPLRPPKEWFEIEEASEPTPLTVDADGRVYGHLALWNHCHAAFASCERPPRSSTNYSFFHVGQIETEEGDLVNVGRITVGGSGNAKGGHASLVLGRQGAMEHYDKTGCVAAFVRAHDGNHGIWLSGAIRSDAPAERIRDLRANPPSGDWRDYELVGVLSVPVPGFPIPRVAEARLVASAAGEEEVAALITTHHTEATFDEDAVIMDGDEVVGQIVTGWTFPCNDMDVLTYRRGMKKLKKRRLAISGDAA